MDLHFKMPSAIDLHMYVDRLSKSRLPKEYAEVKYLESSGTQYIDTGIGNTYRNYFIECRCCQDGDYSIFGDWRRFNLTGSSGIERFYGYNDNKNIMTDIPTDINTPHTWKFDNGELYVDDEHIWSTLVYDGFGAWRNWYLFARNCDNEIDDNGGHVRIYSFKVSYLNNETYIPLRNMLPCVRKSDGKPGMYDLVSGNFFVNIGTGEFTTSEGAE